MEYGLWRTSIRKLDSLIEKMQFSRGNLLHCLNNLERKINLMAEKEKKLKTIELGEVSIEKKRSVEPVDFGVNQHPLEGEY